MFQFSVKLLCGACRSVSKCQTHVRVGQSRQLVVLFVRFFFFFFFFFSRNLNLLVDVVVARTTMPKSKTHMRAVMNTSSHFSFLKRYRHRMILTFVAKRNDRRYSCILSAQIRHCYLSFLELQLVVFQGETRRRTKKGKLMRSVWTTALRIYIEVLFDNFTKWKQDIPHQW